MGYHNYLKLFFGWILTYEEFVKVIRTFEPNIEENDEDIQEFYEKRLNEILDERYGLSIETAYPYYDPEFEYWTFYISLADASSRSYDHSKMDVETVKNILSKDYYLNSNHKKFFTDTLLEYRDPEFISICNVH